jgi:glutamate--cysteine ligase
VNRKIILFAVGVKMYNKMAFSDIKTGLEIELIRVGEDGRLAKTPHPFPNNKNLDRDFCEDQLEIITPPCNGIDEMTDCLHRLQVEAAKGLKNEYLWFCSNPPHFDNEDCIHIAEFSGKQKFKSDYRNSLKDRYGKRIMLYSGIHFNISFGDEFWKYMNVNTEEEKDGLYLKLAKYATLYSWLIVLLTAASPVCDCSIENDNDYDSCFDGYASRRQSEKGYWNSFVPVLDYTSIETYAQSIKKYVEEGVLISPSELYTPIRLKSGGMNNPDTLVEKGVNHIELRMFDINPLFCDGINPNDLKFAHIFMFYIAHLPDFDFTEKMQISAIENHKSAAKFDLSDVYIGDENITTASIEFLENMEKFLDDKKLSEVRELIKSQKYKITKNKRYCVEIKNMYEGNFNGKMFETSKKYTDLKRNEV